MDELCKRLGVPATAEPFRLVRTYNNLSKLLLACGHNVSRDYIRSLVEVLEGDPGLPLAMLARYRDLYNIYDVLAGRGGAVYEV